jgi:hypothetical protein
MDAAKMRHDGLSYDRIARRLSVRKGDVWNCILFLSNAKARVAEANGVGEVADD